MIKSKFAAEDIKNYEFWIRQGKTFDIDIEIFVSLLNHLGFYKVVLNRNTEIVFIENDKRIITKFKSKEETLSAIREGVYTHLKRYQQKILDEFKIDSRKLINDLAKKHKTVFQLEHFDLVPAEKDLTFYKDTKDTAYFFFKNCIAIVTKDKIEIEFYLIGQRKERKKWFVWEKDIIDRKFNVWELRKFVESPFAEFVSLLTMTKAEDIITTNKFTTNKFLNTTCSIGYLLHSFKDESIPKMIIVTEINLTDKAEGGTGKGLLINAIGKLRNLVDIDGKNFDKENRFKFQNVKANTNVVFLNDALANLQLETLYNAITDSFEIERKNKEKEVVTFNASPKIVLATNYDVKGYSTSDKRRKHYVELNSVFTNDYKPIDHFKHLFFKDWNETQWNQFDNFMLFCVKEYFIHGLKDYHSNTLSEKHVINEVGGLEFFKWLQGLEINKYYKSDDIMNSFEETFGKNQKFGNKKVVFDRIRKYAEITGLGFKDKQHHFVEENQRGYILFDKNNKQVA